MYFLIQPARISPKQKEEQAEDSSPDPSSSACDIRIQERISRSFTESFPQKIVSAKLRPHCFRFPRQDCFQKRLEFQPKGTANLQFQNFRKFYAPAVRSPRLRAGRKGLNLKGFATLCVAKKKCFGFEFRSSFWRSQSKTKFCNQSFFVSPMAKLGSDNF